MLQINGLFNSVFIRKFFQFDKGSLNVIQEEDKD